MIDMGQYGTILTMLVERDVLARSSLLRNLALQCIAVMHVAPGILARPAHMHLLLAFLLFVELKIRLGSTKNILEYRGTKSKKWPLHKCQSF